MEYMNLLIKPVSSQCQLQCGYCFYRNEAANRQTADMGRMSIDTAKTVITKLLNHYKDDVTLSLMFQGGEPTLAGLDWYQQFTAIVETLRSRNHHINYGLQTNGLALNADWAAFFRKHDFLVGVSLDGFAANHDQVRTNQSGTATFETVCANIRMLMESGVKTNVLTVVTSRLAGQARQLYDFYRQMGYNWIQLIPCLKPLEAGPQDESEYALAPDQFADFYKAFFDEWYQEYSSGYYRSIGLFDDLAAMFAGQPPLQCGMLGECSRQFVVEADGSVYPCDFYVLDQWRLGNLQTMSFDQLQASPAAAAFISRPHQRCAECANCRFINICHGNCRRLSGCYYNENYCGYQQLLTYIEPKIREIINIK